MSITALPSVRTEIEVAADTIAALMDAGLLLKTPAVVMEACAATKIPIAALRQSWFRREQGYVDPPHEAVIRSVATRQPLVQMPAEYVRGRNLQPRNVKASLRKNPEPGMRVCSYDKPIHHGVGLAIPVEEFGFTNKAAGKLNSRCRRCDTLYARTRTVYLKPGQRAIIVEVMDGDECVGHLCHACNKPFEVGQHVRGDDLRHEDCAATK